MSRKKTERKLLRLLAEGEPVAFDPGVTYGRAARLAVLAEQFGYEYADLRQSGGRFTLFLLPDPRPQARERVAENRSRYPGASEGGPLPVPDPETLALFKARMLSDVQRGSSLKWILPYAGATLALGALEFGTEFGDDRAAVLTIAGVVWAGCGALGAALLLWNRRVKRTGAIRLEAAGFTRMPDERGRLRYVPPGHDERRGHPTLNG
ncbi:hypothetical protein [Streptomyces exfoliatus]|uniref:hypothetical protein n=1 Tax=Streptomyces exfoliatus TaxID=1905 RepID=UPI003C2BB257